MNKTGNLSRVQKMVLMAVLVALTLVMAFTPLGYLKIGLLSISLLSIPVAVGAVVLGPVAGLALGTIFGLTSFFQCFGADAFGTAMFAINPFYTFVVCVVSRSLMGLLSGLIYKGFERLFGKQQIGKYFISDIAGVIGAPVLNTAFFLGFLSLFFFDTQVMGMDVIAAVVLPALSINFVIEIAACAVIGTALSIAIKKILPRARVAAA